MNLRRGEARQSLSDLRQIHLFAESGREAIDCDPGNGSPGHYSSPSSEGIRGSNKPTSTKHASIGGKDSLPLVLDYKFDPPPPRPVYVYNPPTTACSHHAQR